MGEMGSSMFWENLQRTLDAEKQGIYGEKKGRTLRVDLKTMGRPISSLVCQVTGEVAAQDVARHRKLGWAAPVAPLRFGAG